MKKLKLLASILFLICSGIGTHVIAQPTKVTLDSIQSKSAIIDLEYGDAAIKENAVLEKQLLDFKLKDIERVKDSIKQEQQKKDLLLAYSAKSKEVDIEKEINTTYKKIIKRMNIESWFWKAMIPISMVGTYFLVK